MNYEDMSDIAINAHVSRVLYGNISRRHQMEIASGGVDYCNRIEDAWPIIVENHIAVVPYQYTTPQAWPTAFGSASKFTTEDRNPLRAAMIVFLKMREKVQ